MTRIRITHFMSLLLRAINTPLIYVASAFAISTASYAQEIKDLSRCYLSANQDIYIDETRSEILGHTSRGFTTCERVSLQTYKINFNGQIVYVDHDAISRVESLPKSTEHQLGYSSSDMPITLGSTVAKAANTDLHPGSLIRISRVDKILQEQSDPELTAEMNISILENQGWVPVRSEPNLASAFNCPSGLTRAKCRNARAIDSNIKLTPTGKRVFDSDNRIWYVEAKFSHDDNEFSGWFDERQTSLKPFQAEVKEKAANSRTGWINSEIATSEDYTLDLSDEAVQGRTDFFAREDLNKVELTMSDESTRERLATEAGNAFLTNRGLIKIHNNRNGVCGSREYSTGSGGDDSYAKPLTACAISQLAERWRKEYCPSNAPCRLEIGDISHRSRTRFDGHRTHTDGQCVDIRPIRNSSGTNRVAHNGSGNYDRAKTEQLLRLMRELGGTDILFNDKVMIEKGLSRRVRNHDAHIHVCFKDNDTVKNQCANYQPDERMCPSAALMFNHSLMQTMKKSLND